MCQGIMNNPVLYTQFRVATTVVLNSTLSRR
jgi:hypothetical protein